MCLGIPPKYSISSIIGFLKGKSAIRLNPITVWYTWNLNLPRFMSKMEGEKGRSVC